MTTESRQCPHCGAEMFAGWSKCRSCGKRDFAPPGGGRQVEGMLAFRDKSGALTGVGVAVIACAVISLAVNAYSGLQRGGPIDGLYSALFGTVCNVTILLLLIVVGHWVIRLLRKVP